MDHLLVSLVFEYVGGFLQSLMIAAVIVKDFCLQMLLRYHHSSVLRMDDCTLALVRVLALLLKHEIETVVTEVLNSLV